MSDRHEARTESPQPMTEPAGGETPARSSASPARGGGSAAHRVMLIGAAVLLAALVATAPFWAPLLPWAENPQPDMTAVNQGVARLAAALQQAEQQSRQDAAAIRSVLQVFEQRLAGLEATSAGPGGELRQQLQKLAGSLADLTGRIDAIDKSLRAQAGSAAESSSRIEAIDKTVKAQTNAAGELSRRLDAIDNTVRAQANVDATDMALTLALLQIREAVDIGRPFAAEYEAFARFAQGRPDIATAAAPLAEPAKTGVADRAVLARQLGDVAASLDRSPAPTSSGDWGDAALSRLRGLVTIRRIDGAPADGPATVLAAARTALAGGDLRGAIEALDRPSGAATDAARPWLRMARQRLAIEDALRHTEALLVARLAPAASSGSRR